MPPLLERFGGLATHLADPFERAAILVAQTTYDMFRPQLQLAHVGYKLCNVDCSIVPQITLGIRVWMETEPAFEAPPHLADAFAETIRRPVHGRTVSNHITEVGQSPLHKQQTILGTGVSSEGHPTLVRVFADMDAQIAHNMYIVSTDKVFMKFHR